MVSPTTFPRLDLGCGKTIVSCFCNLDNRLNFLDLQNKMKNYQSTLFSFSFSSRSFSIHIHYIQFTLTATSLIVQSPLLLHNPQNNNHRNVSCFSFTCHWFLLNKKKRTRTTPITAINNLKIEIKILLHSDTKAIISNELVC